jgi:ribosomal protein S18 acetylase RimI-like enzyme
MIFQYTDSPSQRQSLQNISEQWQQEGAFWPYDELAKSMEKSDIAIFYAAETQESPWAGAVVLNLIFFEAEILFIYVSPTQRRTGIAESLVQEAINFCRMRPCSKILLEVAAKNLSALKLYEKIGFEVYRSRPKYYANGDDALMMSLDLVGAP